MNIYRIVLGNTDTDIDIGATNELGRRLIGVDKNGWEEWLVLVEPDYEAVARAYESEDMNPQLSSEQIHRIVEAAFGGLL